MTTYYNGRYNQGCSTFTLEGDGSQTPHKMTSCFEKWRKSGSGTREYIYNRWMLFTKGRAGSFPEVNYLKDLTIRSRQWKGQDRLSQMVGWQPAVGGNSNCSDTATLSLSISGIGISAPIKKCDYNTLLLDTNMPKGLIGLDWDGKSSSTQHRLDAARKTD